jgi:hypothetical protein
LAGSFVTMFVYISTVANLDESIHSR